MVSGRKCAKVAGFLVASSMLALVCVASISHVVAASTVFQSQDRAAVAELMAYYSSSDALVGDEWWQSALAVDTVASYQQSTGDDEFSFVYTSAFDRYRGRFDNAFMDDTAWWALAWLRVYDLTGDHKYLNAAEAQADYINTSWDATCGGGIWWSAGKTYKNAIANELFLQLNAALHNRIPDDEEYLSRATAEWAWFSGSGLINKNGLVNDGLNESCSNNGAPTWSYNQGVILAGLSELYRATADASLLTTARSIADAEIRNSTPAGVLQEWCEPGPCTVNQASFKGVFVTDLQELVETTTTTNYAWFIQKQRASVLSRNFNDASAMGVHWAGPWSGANAAAQISGIQALLAGLGPYSKPVTVTFDPAGGTAVPTVSLLAQQEVPEPPNPMRAGYYFDGWYSENDTNTKTNTWNFSKSVESDLTLQAHWRPVSQTSTPTPRR